MKFKKGFYDLFDAAKGSTSSVKTLTSSISAHSMDNPAFSSNLDNQPTKLYPELKKANTTNGSAGGLATSSVTPNGDANGGGPPQGGGGDYQKPDKNPSKLKRASKKVNNRLQSNRITRKFFPPSDNVAMFLTIAVTVVGVFLVARTVLGEIAAPGGTVFALLVLICLALLGGLFVKLMGRFIGRLAGVDLSLPPLLGMLLVGIALKNVPYNFGQFGRAECSGDFGDSLHDIQKLNDTEEFLEQTYGFDIEINHPHHINNLSHEVAEALHNTTERLHRRSVGGGHGGGHGDAHGADSNASEHHDPCRKRYIGHELDPLISRTLRSICLTVILLMAGLELDPVALWNMSGMVVSATFVPCFTEAIAVAVFSHFLLGFDWSVGFMLGFVLAAVSPAVIIPSLMNLSQRGYGVAKGIPTLVIAACSADDVVAISGFGIFLGITFQKDAPITKLIFHGPIEVILGLSFGIFWGVLAQWIPNRHNKNVAFFRFIILFMGGLIALFGAHQIHYDGAGGLATIIMAFVAGMQWRREGWGDHNPVTKTFQKMWIILEPVIFALIGTEIQVDKINGGTLGMGILVLVIALVLRMIGTFFAVSCGSLNVKEKIFMAFAWLPKATVQAALGPIFLDNVLHNKNKYEQEEFKDLEDTGNQILTLAVLSILITAPLGAIAILALGPHLLEAEEPPKDPEEGGAVENHH